MLQARSSRLEPSKPTPTTLAHYNYRRLITRLLPFVVAAVVYLALPVVIQGDFALSILCLGGIVAIGAIGLNLLTGLSGQVSLGHAFFVGVGAYAGAYLGDNLRLPLIAWLPLVGVIGGIAGLLFGPIALRLRGTYLVIVTLGLVYIGIYLFQTVTVVTGGLTGRSVAMRPRVGPLNFTRLTLGGQIYSRNQGMFWLIWLIVIIATLTARNLGRGRTGRALQTIRDRPNVAAAVGIPVAAYKIRAFVVSSAFAAAAGGLYALYVQFIDPQQFDLTLSIQYITVIIIGGMGSVWGSIAGAVIVSALPDIIQRFSGSLPFIATTSGSNGSGLSVFVFDQLIYGVLIIAFLIFEPNGLRAIALRVYRLAVPRSWIVSGRWARNQISAGGEPVSDKRKGVPDEVVQHG